ncbi:MAG TPA: chemotaxis protein CheB [Roseiarcus sp.]|nr:chemotaxis protein CheB [Roseiarcus sp.]
MSNDDPAPPNPQPASGEFASSRIPTVGIGSSAGGVHALQMFFESLPHSVDAAFVVVVHLDPEHQSELPAILAQRTKMPVTQVSGRVRLESGHVYVIPPNRQLMVTDQHLAIAEFGEPRWQRAPIDLFFRSLAAQGGDDFAMVFSGAGSDGAVGIKAVKEAGGIILVQDPDEAEYASMPRAAVSTGLADFVLPVREIAERLPELIANRGRIGSEAPDAMDGGGLQRILSHLRVRSGHDFSSYKKSTVRRRIARRMQVQRARTMSDYLAVLRDNPAEAQALFADLLISVTTFFRDSSAFDTLAATVIPRLFEDKGAGDSVRVWVPGCATGEEAYSIAVLLLEEAARHDIRCQIQLFASDLDDAALTAAREGRYPLAIEADMTEQRLRSFFSRDGDHYRVSRDLRDIVLFAKHSLLRDPPFSRVGLVSCRNVLIYLDRELQQQVLSTFHFALQPQGYLFVGSSENADAPVGMFRALDRGARIYQRMAMSNEVRVPLRIAGVSAEPLPARMAGPLRAPSEAGAHREALERLAPPSAVVDQSYRVVHLSEHAGRYLQPSGGTLVNDITELAREELRLDLRAALHRVLVNNEPSLTGPIAVRFNGDLRRVYLQARPLDSNPNASRAAIVFFFEGETLGDVAIGAGAIDERRADEQSEQLQHELQFARLQLRTSREEQEGANEELRAANEELQSINEEYRSTAEELETSTEELQSMNEELQTVNAELKAKLESVSRANSDIQNLMAATDVGILFIDTQLRINRFTPPIAELFNVAAGDAGRLITDFTHSLDYQDLAADARKVLRDLIPIEREIRGGGGWRLMRLKPYRTVEDKIDGVVVTFVDIDERHRAVDALRESEARLRAVIDGAADSIVTIDEAGVIQSLNAATTKMFGYAPDELIGRNVDILVEPHHSLHDGYIKRYVETGEASMIGVGREIEARRKDDSIFPAELTVSEIRHGGERLFIGFLRDLSERRRFEQRLDRLHSNRLDSMADMATALAHELNQPLAAAANYLFTARHILGLKPGGADAAVDDSLDKASAQMHRAGQIIAHLREFMARGEPDKIELGLHDLIKTTCELVAPSAREAGVDIVLSLDAAEDEVLADRIQVEQAMVNLIRNAIEAMSDAPRRRLTISTALEDGMIRVEFADTGRGLQASAADMFTPFSSTKTDGLGVGLSISRSIIEAHYGTIWAQNNPRGGAKFSFTLPLARLEKDRDGEP